MVFLLLNLALSSAIYGANAFTLHTGTDFTSNNRYYTLAASTATGDGRTGGVKLVFDQNISNGSLYRLFYSKAGSDASWNTAYNYYADGSATAVAQNTLVFAA